MRPFDIAVAGVLLILPITSAGAQSETPVAPAERACPPGAGSANPKPGETTGAPSLSEKLAEFERRHMSTGRSGPRHFGAREAKRGKDAGHTAAGYAGR